MRSEIACLVVTHQITEEAMPWMKHAREVFGRLVVFVDQLRALPHTETRAREVASVVHQNNSAAFFGSDFKAMIDACESDWVMFLDHDEELSPEWSDAAWRSLLRNAEFTHYFFGRRWVPDKQKYIRAEPWWPDPQLRLFQADAAVRFPTRPHEPVTVSGPGAFVRHLAIHHHIWLLDRSAREEKTKLYDSLLPGGALEYFYRHGEFRPKELPLPPPARFDSTRDVVTMPRLEHESAGSVVLEPHDLPERMGRGELFWSRVQLRNGSGSTLVSAPLYPVRVSYHWRDATTGAVELYDGLRSSIAEPVLAGEERELEFVVLSPARAGIFLLELTLVQEQNFWFDEVLPGFAKTFRIEVV